MHIIGLAYYACILQVYADGRLLTVLVAMSDEVRARPAVDKRLVYGYGYSVSVVCTLYSH